MIQTLENIAALRCEAFAQTAEGLADGLRALKTEEAKQHAREAIGAAKLARQWGRELRKIHARKQKEPHP